MIRRKVALFAALLAGPVVALVSCANDHRSGVSERTQTLSSALLSGPSPELPNFVVYAERSITLGPGDLIFDGDVGVHSASSQGGTQLTIGGASVVDDENNVFAPSVSLGLLASVGNLETYSLQNNGGDTGTVTSFPNAARSDVRSSPPSGSDTGTVTSFPNAAMPPLPFAPAGTPSSNNVSVAPFQIMTLNPGSYGTLSVTGTLLLNPGTYSFASVTVANQGHVWANPGGVTMLVQGALTAGTLSTFQPVLGQAAADLTISVSGQAATGTDSPVVSFGTGSTIIGLLAAP
ncbi:MAG: hypothetical protein ACREJ3_05440, partial [Polyangiaceae bacterium]